MREETPDGFIKISSLSFSRISEKQEEEEEEAEDPIPSLELEDSLFNIFQEIERKRGLGSASIKYKDLERKGDDRLIDWGNRKK